MTEEGSSDASSKLVSQLPPKGPAFGSEGSLGQGKFLKYQRMPFVGYLSQFQLSSMGDLLDSTSGILAMNGAQHRRSASDSLAFLEPPMDSNPAEETADDDEFYKLEEEEQLLTVFSEFEALRKKQKQIHTNLPSNSTPPLDNRCSGQQSKNENLSNQHEQISLDEASTENKVVVTLVKTDSELQSQQQCQTIKTEMPTSSSPTRGQDLIMDPKRIKRILANRQSAQRSRLRKLQYIAMLEKRVKELETQVTTYNSQVQYLERQRALLNCDNRALRQKIIASKQDENFRNESAALNKEVQRLLQLYREQQQHHHILRGINVSVNVSSTGTLDLQEQMLGKLEQGSFSQMRVQKLDVSKSSNIMKSREEILDYKESNVPHNHTTFVYKS